MSEQEKEPKKKLGGLEEAKIGESRLSEIEAGKEVQVLRRS